MESKYASVFTYCKENNISDEERDFIIQKMELSDNNLLFTKEQFGHFVDALDRQFPLKTENHKSKFERSHGITHFDVHPLNNGIKFDGILNKTFLSLPYISPDFHLFRPHYNSTFVGDVVSFPIARDASLILLSYGRHNECGSFLSCFNRDERKCHIGGGRLFHKPSAVPMESLESLENKHKQYLKTNSGPGYLIVSDH